MKKIVELFVMLLVALGLVTTASATTVSLDFTAKVRTISQIIPGNPDIYFDSAAGFSIGENISGSIKYNTDYALVIPGYDRPTFRAFTLSSDATIEIYYDRKTLIKDIDTINIMDNYNPLDSYYLDRFAARNSASRDTADWIQLWLDGSSTIVPSSMLSSTDLTLPISDFSMADFTQSPITFNTPELFNVDARIMTFSVNQGVAPVPEPATFLLLGSGLAGLVFYRRKKK